MDRDPIPTAARLTKRKAYLGPEPHICILCGYINPWGLVKVFKTLLELHHVVFKGFDPLLTVLLCRNCHAEVTEDLRRVGQTNANENNAVLRVALMIEALSVFLEALVPALRRWAGLLRNSQNMEKKT